MTEPRRIAVVTGSRAEFGLLAPVMRAIAAHDALTLGTIVAGAHLVSGTDADVEAAGFTIDARVAMHDADGVGNVGGRTGRAADAVALGRGVGGFAGVFEAMKPAVVVVLGDRIEAFAAAAAASVGGVRVAHLHGGDRAEGVADEAMRHAVTKLAHLHLPATAESRRRIIRMGEAPEHVFRVGSPAVDGLRAVRPATGGPRAIVLQHPIGDDAETERRRMAETLAATAAIGPRLVLMPNTDPGCEGVQRAIEESGLQPTDDGGGDGQARVGLASHLPRERFLAMLKGAAVIVGNSSAGLIEAAALRTPCVNVGPRQGGRQRPANVVDCDYGRANVEAAIRRALDLDLRSNRHPYGSGRTGPAVAELFAAVDLDAIPIRKRNRY